MRRAYLDIDIGDPAAHAAATAAHDRTVAFMAAGGAARAGLPPDAALADLDADAAALVVDAYAADPAWASRGPSASAPPPPLRAGRLVVELERAAAPRAVANFEALCAGTATSGSSEPLHYQHAVFHRIVSGFVCQGGDVVFGRGPRVDARRVGAGAVSVYGAKFKDEPGGLKLKHGRGTVGMANSGKHGNACQFYVVLGNAQTPAVRALDGKHVVVGRVVSDEGGVLDRIEAEAASLDGVPRVRVAVGGCGVLDA